MSFQGKIVVVTGGASGIGLELGRQLGRAGSTVVLADLNLEKAQQAAAELSQSGCRVSAFPCDVTRAEQFQALIDDTVARHGRVDYLFNNAGVGLGGEVRDLSLENWHFVLDVNLNGVLHGIQAAYPQMIRQGSGHIINTASAAGLITAPMMAPYAAAKHAVVGLSKALRAEAKDLGVRISVLCPGFIQTNIFEASPFVGIQKERFVLKLPFRFLAVDDAVRRILRGVEKNQLIITFPFYVKLMILLQALCPPLARFFALQMVRDFRKKASNAVR